MTFSETALLIEDDEGVAEAGKEMLKTCGFKVLHFVTADAGWEAFQSRPFDLVLSDINLPGQMNGVDLARSIRRNRPGAPIILATGYSHLADVAEREFVVLRKPYGMDQFRDAVKTVKVAREA